MSAPSNWGTGSSYRTGAGHAKRKAIVLARDKGRCQLRYPGCTGKGTEADHIINVAAGGVVTIDNMQAACESCHTAKTQEESATARRTNQKKRFHPDRYQGHPGLN
ncbi:HNH endonuclease [Rhodococcus sp. IEGM1428]|uniref:HNH endonuclease n=1 Tax=Rhodococcus sp. IEGM1428 TaxID=3392191 RepID=UPI003D1263AC